MITAWPEDNLPIFVGARDGRLVHAHRMRDVGPDCFQLQKGYSVALGQGGMTFTPVSEVRVPPPAELTLPEAAEALNGVLMTALSARLRDEQRPALAFSGGVDSFLVAAALHQIGVVPRLYVLDGLKPTDDARLAEAHADLFGWTVQRVAPCEETLARYCNETAYRYEWKGPYDRLSGHVGEIMLKHAMLADGVDIAIFGTGADQWHADYRDGQNKTIAELLRPHGATDSRSTLCAHFQRWLPVHSGFMHPFGGMVTAKLFHPDLDVLNIFADPLVAEFFMSLPDSVRYAEGFPGLPKGKKKAMMRYLMRELYPASDWGARKMYQEGWCSGLRKTASHAGHTAFDPATLSRLAFANPSILP